MRSTFTLYTLVPSQYAALLQDSKGLFLVEQATVASIISFVLGRKVNYETQKNGTNTKVASLYSPKDTLVGKPIIS